MSFRLILFVFLMSSSLLQVLFAQDDSIEDGAYREIRLKTWAWLGADEKEIAQTLQKIKETKKKGDYWDLGNTEAPGHWKHEFQKLGDKYLKIARKFKRKNKLEKASKSYTMVFQFL